MKFAMVGFARDVEKKYYDKHWQAGLIEVKTGSSVNPPSPNNGFTYHSGAWGSYEFNDWVISSTAMTNNMLAGVPQGTLASTRVGNKINVKYLKGAMTFTAAGVSNVGGAQGGETQALAGGTPPEMNYMRTSWRCVIVKDLQVNSADAHIGWSDVFGANGKTAGVHDELKVENMGRFRVLKETRFTLDAVNPQKTVPYLISGRSVGSVRYNGSGSSALTNTGVYMVCAAFVMGTGLLSTSQVLAASPVGHSRICFTD